MTTNGRITVVSALPGGNAEQVLRCIAQSSHDRWQFEQESETTWRGMVQDSYRDVSVPVTLMLGRVEGLHLRDQSQSNTWSAKPVCREGAAYVLEIGARVPRSRLSSIANNLFVAWVIRGFEWTDHRGQSFQMPYGRDPDPNNCRQRRKRRPDRRRRRNIYARYRW